jgi:hypothetical protein
MGLAALDTVGRNNGTTPSEQFANVVLKLPILEIESTMVT